MNEEDKKICEKLIQIGMTEEQIENAFKTNTNLKKVLDIDVVRVMIFLIKNYNLTEQEVAKIASENPWILTESFERMRYLEESYTKLGIEIKELLIKQPIAISLNPKLVDNFIQELKNENKTDEEIKQIILNELNEYFSI
ncbi:MAG: hypothetical protein IKL68_04830 [Clostridia bacterium]|nr:hypothetical protein [Clostridia bacterium]